MQKQNRVSGIVEKFRLVIIKTRDLVVKYFRGESVSRPWFILAVVLMIYIVGLAGAAVAVYGYKIHTAGVKALLKIYPLPAVMIDAQTIPAGFVYERMEYIQTFNLVNGQPVPSDQELRTQVIDQLIEDYLYRVAALSAGVVVTDEEVNATFAKIAEENGGEEAVAQALQNLYGMTVADLRKLIKTQLVKDRVKDEGIEQVKLKHILVSTEDTAKKVVAEIKAGKNFEDAAKEYSTDSESRDKGGEVGWVYRGMLDPKLDEKIFDVSVGVLFEEPIQSQYGWHIIKVEEKKGTIKNSLGGLLSDQKSHTRIWRLLK